MVTSGFPASRRAGRKPRTLTLFAALALLFTATHCVDIDDRELEETNPACEIDASDDACGVCIKENCCDTFAACVESVDCQYFNACLAACDYDAACVDPCAVDYPEGLDIFLEYFNCSTNACPVECGVGPDAAG